MTIPAPLSARLPPFSRGASFPRPKRNGRFASAPSRRCTASKGPAREGRGGACAQARQPRRPGELQNSPRRRRRLAGLFHERRRGSRIGAAPTIRLFPASGGGQARGSAKPIPAPVEQPVDPLSASIAPGPDTRIGGIRGQRRLERGGGEGGIRTLGTLARSTVFETAPIDHSGTSPHARPGPCTGAPGRRAARSSAGASALPSMSERQAACRCLRAPPT